MIFFPKRAIRAGKIFHTADRHRGGVRRFEFVLRLVLGKKCAARAACIPRVKHSVNGAKAYRSRVLRDPIAAGDRMAFARDDAGCEAGSLFFFGVRCARLPNCLRLSSGKLIRRGTRNSMLGVVVRRCCAVAAFG